MHVTCTNTNDAVTHGTHRALGINMLWPTNYCFDYSILWFYRPAGRENGISFGEKFESAKEGIVVVFWVRSKNYNI